MLSKQQFTKVAANREAKDPRKNEYLISLRKLYELEDTKKAPELGEAHLSKKMHTIHALIAVGLL